MASNFVQFRAGPELLDAIDDYADNLREQYKDLESPPKITRSSVVRELVAAALQTPTQRAAAEEATMLVVRIQNRLVNELTELMQSRIRDLLLQEITESSVVD